MRHFLFDLRVAFRSLARSPLMLASSVVTLGVAIGLATAVFSVVDAVVLRPLPVRDPGSLIALCEADKNEASDWCAASVPDVADIAARSRTIAVAGVARQWPVTLRTTSGVEGLTGGLANADAFRALGVTAAKGRLFVPEDAGREWRRVAVLSDGLWRNRFGARDDIVGSVVTIDDEPLTVVGVLPPGAAFPRLEDVDLWRPVHVGPHDEDRRDWRGFLAFARLRDGASLPAARQEVAAIAADIQRDHFPTRPGWSIAARTWQDVVTASVRGAMYLFLGAVGFLLLIGCANVANLLLARSSARQHELGVRAALGASTSRLASGTLAESFVIALLGTALGVVLAWGAVRLAVALAPQGIPRIDSVTLDPRALAFAAALTVAATMLVGLVPAIRAMRADLRATIGEGRRTSSGRRSRTVSGALVVAEIALAVVLASGAGLLGRSFATLARWTPGFDRDHLVTSWLLATPGQFKASADMAAYFQRVEDAAAEVPGITAVATGSAGPLFGGDGASFVTIDGAPAPEGSRQVAEWFDVGPRYFATLGVPVVRGRSFGPDDRISAPLVAVVNETFVARYLAGREPLGRRIHMQQIETDFTIVGVVRDVPPPNPGDPRPAQVFWPNRQLPRYASYLIVRTAGPPAAIVGALRDRLHALDPTLQVSRARTMNDWLDRQLVRPRFAVTLIGTFGIVALVLAAIGTYGLLAYLVAQESRQIGIRMALGARPASVVAMVVGRGMRLAGAGIVIGLIGAVALTRFLAGLLAGVSPLDPVSLGGSVVALGVVAALACLVPARQAIRVDPATALRAE